MKILVVEDNPDVGPLFTRMLAINGLESRLATTVVDALAIAGEMQPDLVLLDLGMPREEDGYQLAVDLRLVAGLKDAKIVALSGFARDERRQAACGIDGHLMKPVKLAVVLKLAKGEAVAL